MHTSVWVGVPVYVRVSVCLSVCAHVYVRACGSMSVRACTLVQVCVNVWVLMNCCVCVFECSILGYSFSGCHILQ